MNDNDDGYSRYQRQEQRRRKLAADLRISTKAKLFDALEAADIASVTVTFDGQGDSGQIEDISPFCKANKPRKLPRRHLAIQTANHDGSSADEETLTVEQVLEHLCYDLLEDDQGGWEINEGAFGEFVFDVTDRSLTLTFNARFSDFETSTATY